MTRLKLADSVALRRSKYGIFNLFYPFLPIILLIFPLTANNRLSLFYSPKGDQNYFLYSFAVPHEASEKYSVSKWGNEQRGF